MYTLRWPKMCGGSGLGQPGRNGSNSIGKIWLFDPEFKNPTGFLGEFPKCIQITYLQ